MKISVLVPHKNNSSKLARLLSTIPQWFSVIVVDDYSDAAVLSKVKTLSKVYHNLRVYENRTESSNAGTARNIALEHCDRDTDWVIFADADDEFSSTGIGELYNYLLNQSSIDILFFRCSAKYESSGDYSKRAEIYSKLIQNWPHSESTIGLEWKVPWGKAIRFSVLTDNVDVRFAPRIASNDVEFSMRLALLPLRKGAFNQNVVYICNQSSDSLTGNLNAEKAVARLKANVSCNKLLYINNISSVRCNYSVAFFIKGFFKAIKSKDFYFFGDFLVGFFIAVYINNFKRFSLNGKF